MLNVQLLMNCQLVVEVTKARSLSVALILQHIQQGTRAVKIPGQHLLNGTA